MQAIVDKEGGKFKIQPWDYRFYAEKLRKAKYDLDFYCPAAKLSIELDGFHHGLPEQREHDVEREKFLGTKGILELRFWNRQWRKNREGVLLEIWNALHQRTGCAVVMRKVKNHRFVAPDGDKLLQPPMKEKASSPQPSPH